MTEPEKPARLDELNALFQLMWTDSLDLLNELTKGLDSFRHAAQLSYLAGFLLLIDAALLAAGQIATPNVALLVVGMATLAVAAFAFYIAAGLRKRYKFMADRYPRMRVAAEMFKKYEQRTEA